MNEIINRRIRLRKNDIILMCCIKPGTRPERLPCFDELCWNLMEDCWAGEPTQRPLLGHVHSRLEAIFISHCHGRTIDTGNYNSINDSFVEQLNP